MSAKDAVRSTARAEAALFVLPPVPEPSREQIQAFAQHMGLEPYDARLRLSAPLPRLLRVGSRDALQGVAEGLVDDEVPALCLELPDVLGHGQGWHEALRVRQVELDAISRSVLVALCSTEDEAVMRSVYGALPPTVVIANGTKVDEIPFATGVERIANRTAWLRSAGFAADKRIALYLASWHPPNLEAAEQIHAMAPELPDVLFLMIGSHVDYFAGRRLPENVLQIGLVGDATKRVLLSSADLGVNPMATGSGTNLKLVEYLASGLQTVTTATGARGLPDSELFTTSDLPGFAAAIEAAIATDHDAAASIDRAVRARAMIEEQFAWRVLGERLADAVQRAVVDG